MAAMVIWIVLGWISRVVPLQFLQSFFGAALPIERMVVHLALSFLFVGCYALHRLAADWRSFVAVTFAALLALGTGIFTTKFFYAFLGIAALYGLKELISREKIEHHHLVIGSILLLFLLFPLTGKVETTNLQPRVAYFTVDDAKMHLSRDDVFYFVGGWSLDQAILACTPTHSIIQIDRDYPISGLSSDIDVFDPSEKTKEILQRRGVSRLLIVLDKIVENNQINEQKVAHLVQWFGQPTLMQPRMVTEEKEQNYYPILVFTIPPITRDYELEKLSPRATDIINIQQKDSLLVNLEYHPWWKAEDALSDAPLEIINEGGLMRFKGISQVEKIELRFSLKYFIMGFILSLIGIWLFVREYRQRRSTS
jgi:hypothetical protein